MKTHLGFGLLIVAIVFSQSFPVASDDRELAASICAMDELKPGTSKFENCINEELDRYQELDKKGLRDIPDTSTSLADEFSNARHLCQINGLEEGTPEFENCYKEEMRAYYGATFPAAEPTNRKSTALKRGPSIDEITSELYERLSKPTRKPQQGLNCITQHFGDISYTNCY